MVVLDPLVAFALSPPVAAAPPMLLPLVPFVDVPFVDADAHGAFALFVVFGTVLVPLALELEGVVPVVALEPLLL